MIVFVLVVGVPSVFKIVTKIFKSIDLPTGYSTAGSFPLDGNAVNKLFLYPGPLYEAPLSSHPLNDSPPDTKSAWYEAGPVDPPPLTLN